MVALGGGAVSHERGTPVFFGVAVLDLRERPLGGETMMEWRSFQTCSWTMITHDGTQPQGDRRRASMAHVRQTRPDSGIGFAVKVFGTF